MTVPADTAVADPEIAHLLGESAMALARDGATADDLSPLVVPSGLEEALRTVMRAPDPMTGRLVVRGLLACLTDPGPTPAHWREARTESTRALDLAVRIVASAVGSVFGWTGQQDGRLVHNILPNREAAHQQVGASSAVPLYWHSEDAFHPQRAGVLLLACVRNDEGVGSRVASVREAGLTDRQRQVLSSPGAAILPDDSYPQTSRKSGGRTPCAASRRSGNATTAHASVTTRHTPASSRTTPNSSRPTRSWEWPWTAAARPCRTRPVT